MIFKVNILPVKDGYTAQSEFAVSMWSNGVTIDEAIKKFKEQYSDICKLQFADGNIEFDFHVKLKE